MMPVQMKIMSGQFTLRQGSMQWTDKRARLLTEVLGSMRIVKYFTYEAPFLRRIFDIRRNELRGIRRIQFLRSTNLALAFAVPVLAATIAFVVYSAVTSKFDVAVVFSSLSLFNVRAEGVCLTQN
jgi:ATP-binding cassette subfamily C (CFTR/MRP) protein 1